MFDTSLGERNFILISAQVMDAPKCGGILNFIQMKRNRRGDWELDIQGTPGPYYFRMVDMPRRTKIDPLKRRTIVLEDAPGGALSEYVDFYTAVVEVNRSCEIDKSTVFNLIKCYDQVKVLASMSWRYDPALQDPYVYPEHPDGLFKRVEMIREMQKLINSKFWHTEFCSDTKVEVVE